MGKVRKVVFYLFLVLYLVVAPLTVLYALGYILSPSEPALLQTGLINLETEPARASVWVNDSPIKEKTPVVLRNLKPGTYTLRVSLPGYHPWEKRVEVKPEEALRLEEILLFPKEAKREILSDFPLTKIWSTRGGKSFLILKGNEASGLYRFDLEEMNFEPIFSSPQEGKALVKELYLHSGGDRALVLLQKGNAPVPTLIKFQSPLRVAFLTDFFPESFAGLSWGSAHKGSVFYLKQDTLQRLDLERGLLQPTVAKQVLGYTLHEGRLFVLDRKGRFLELTEKGKLRDILLEDPRKARLIFGAARGETFSIHFLPNESVFFFPKEAVAVFLASSGRLLSNKLPYALDEGVEEGAVAHAHPRMVYRKGAELWMVDFAREKEKTFFETGPTPRRVYTGSGPLGQVEWFYHDRYLLFLEGNQVRVQDFEGEEKGVSLVEVSPRVQGLFLDEKRGFLYFAEPGRERLARVKLFDKGGIRDLRFHS